LNSYETFAFISDMIELATCKSFRIFIFISFIKNNYENYLSMKFVDLNYT